MIKLTGRLVNHLPQRAKIVLTSSSPPTPGLVGGGGGRVLPSVRAAGAGGGGVPRPPPAGRPPHPQSRDRRVRNGVNHVQLTNRASPYQAH
eukprot:6535789-Pyramimonas_sp.AAC.2